MCGRYTQNFSWQEVHDFLSLLPGVPMPEHEEDFAPRLDIRPTQTVPVLRKRETGSGYDWVRMRWGFDVSWSKRLLINAKAESMAGKFWSGAMPAVVLASGFYEWPLKKGGKKPANYGRYLFTLKDKPVMMLAALWRTWSTKDGDETDCMVIGTTAPNPLMAKLPHHRMAAILDEENFQPWMQAAPDGRAELLTSYPSQLMNGQAVSEPKKDDPATLLPIGEPLAT